MPRTPARRPASSTRPPLSRTCWPSWPRPKPGDTICDPACGSGSLLIRAAEEVGSENFALYGQEVNGATWALARMNMFLHAKDAARIEWCDTLNSPALIEGDQLMKFDVVVANPPFSLDKWGAENADTDQFKRFWRGIPPKSKGDYAFITHMIEIAKRQSGRVAVIVPHGVLFRGGAEGQIRQALIEENLLDAVIGLPANLFTTTGIPVAILVFDRSREQGGANEDRARRPVHRRQQGIHARQDAERDGRGAHRQGPRDLRRTRRKSTNTRTAPARRKSPRTTSTSTSPATSTPSSPRRKSTSPPCRRRSTRSKPSWPRCAGKMAGYLKELGVDA